MSRLGLNGSRSGLFYRFAELIGEKKPQVVLIENVAGLFNSNNGHDFGVILDTLNQLGYGVSWRLLNSRYFGVPQSRPRVYLCCWRGTLLKHWPRFSRQVLLLKQAKKEPLLLLSLLRRVSTRESQRQAIASLQLQAVIPAPIGVELM